MKIYVVRHGETDWNVQGKFQGKTDVSLNDNGINQSFELNKMLNDKNIDLCFCSPLKRAKQTAINIVNNKYPIIEDELLIERALGIYEGKIRNNSDYNGKTYWNYKLDSHENGVESIRQLFNRAELFLKKIKNKYSDKTILIVSHGATIRAINYIILGYTSDEEFLDLDVPNCSLFEYDL